MHMKVYYSSIKPWENTTQYLCGLAKVSAERQRKVARYKQPADKIRCLLAGLLLRHVLGDVVLQDAILTEHGKPSFLDCVPFSLSHSGDYVALAVAQCQGHVLGVDVEKVKRFLPGVAEKCFTVQEQTWLQSQPQGFQQQAFCTLWTGKESVLKATGLGFALQPASFSLIDAKGQRLAACAVNDDTWHMYWRELPEYMLCVASNKAITPDYVALYKEDLLADC